MYSYKIRALTVTFLVCLVAFSCLFDFTHAGSCSPRSNLPTYRWSTKTAEVTIKGLSVSIVPLIAKGLRYEGMQMDMSMSSVVESTLSPEKVCSPGGFPTEIDSYGIQTLDVDLCDCTSTEFYSTDIIGVVERIVEVTATCQNYNGTDTYNNMTLITKYRLPDKDYQRTYPGSVYTGNEEMIYSYYGDQVSVSFDIQNWPWNQTYAQNDTYVAIYLSFLNKVSEDGVASADYSPERNSFQLRTASSVINVTIESGYLIDGIAYIPPTQTFSQEIPVGEGELDLILIKPFCTNIRSQESVKWTNMTYDPTLNALYLGDIPVTKSNNAWKVALAVLLSLLGLFIIFGLVWIFVPSVRNIVRPFRKRSKAEATSLSDTQKSNTWSSARKPTSQ